MVEAVRLAVAKNLRAEKPPRSAHMEEEMADTKNKTREEIEAEDGEEPLIVTLEYDDGTVVETEVMGVFEADGKEYIALIPHDDTDDVYIYGYKETGEDEFDLVDIEDDEEFKRAVEEFDKLVSEEE